MAMRNHNRPPSNDAHWVVAMLSLLAVTGLAMALTWWTSSRASDVASHNHVGGTLGWPWIITLIGLNVGVMLACLRIYLFWCRAYFDEEPRDRNGRHMDLAQIFLWCAVCGFATSALMFFWPAYQLVAVCLLMLNIWSWRLVFKLSGFHSTFSASRYRRLAETDRLTGLLNRFAITQMLERDLLPVEDGTSRDVALMFLDLDRFKLVNDSMGHDAGDDLLRQIAGRLFTAINEAKAEFPPDTKCIAARLGGDEFIVLIRGAVDHQQIAVVNRLVHMHLSRPYELGQRTIQSSASIGVTSTAIAYESAADMFRDADTAMYVAKQRGRGITVYFDRVMHEDVRRAIEIEHDLRHAIQRDEMVLHYQPIIDLDSGEVTAFEALLRWNHSQRGRLMPDEFISVAEDSGEIVALGRWVMQQSIHQFAAWRRALPELTNAMLSINLSPKQLNDADLVAFAAGVAQQNDVPTNLICLEITESTVMQDRGQAICRLQHLRDAGFRLAMDDFGTGYSSLSCLHEFPIDTIKIDQRFIANLSGRRDYAAVVNAIATLASNLGFTVIAEGVETPEQLAQLQALSCDAGQGHYFQPAAPVHVIEAYLTKRRNNAQSA